MVIEDWIVKSLDQYTRQHEDGGLSYAETIKLTEILQANSPFKEGVAYMPVPRCETCAHWHPDGTEMNGDCHLEVDVSHPKMRTDDNCGGNSLLETTADFGCVQWEEKT